MASMSPVHLGTIIALGFTPLILCRSFLKNRFITSVSPDFRASRSFFLDFSICCLAVLVINIYNYFSLGFPLSSLLSLLTGGMIAGFFIGLDSSLAEERQVITEAIDNNLESPLPDRFFPMTRKFTLVAISTSVFIAIVLILVFSRDIEWLSKTAQNPNSIAEAKMSVIYEIFFIMGILMVLLTNLIVSYSKNLKLLFNNQTQILEKVSLGDLSHKVPVATHDEFGLIAGHTNHMIDGLRHRFELITSLKLAEEVQQNLLPSKSPYLRDFEISGSSSYCEQTGGDYYDYLLLPGDKIGIVVADACGHGIGAALLMTSVRAFLISAISNYTEPSQLVMQVNRLITKDCSVGGRFTTMFFLEIEPSANRLRWVRAGHEPALLYHARTRSFSRLLGSGLALGIDESYRFTTEMTEDLENGDILFLGTDGISETRNDTNTLWGQESVKNIIEANREQPAGVIRERLVSAVNRFRGSQPQEDDITLVVIKYNQQKNSSLSGKSLDS